MYIRFENINEPTLKLLDQVVEDSLSDNETKSRWSLSLLKIPGLNNAEGVIDYYTTPNNPGQFGFDWNDTFMKKAMFWISLDHQPDSKYLASKLYKYLVQYQPDILISLSTGNIPTIFYSHKVIDLNIPDFLISELTYSETINDMKAHDGYDSPEYTTESLRAIIDDDDIYQTQLNETNNRMWESLGHNFVKGILKEEIDIDLDLDNRSISDLPKNL